MNNQTENGQSQRAVRGLEAMGPFIERLHVTADHLHRLMGSGFQHSQLGDVGFLFDLLREDALTLLGLYTQATKTDT